MMELGDIAVNKAEMQTKASPFWTGLIAQIVEARRVANIARVEYEYIEKRYGEWQSQEANNRVAARI
jgi:hypothetical protein